MFYIFYPTALARAFSQRPKFVMAEHLATAKGKNCVYGPTLFSGFKKVYIAEFEPLIYNIQ